MEKPQLITAQQVAQAASVFQHERTGHAPKAVTVVLCHETFVVTLHGVLTPAEIALSRSPNGAARVQEFHRQLFVSASDGLREEVERITGVHVRQAASEVQTATGTVVHAFTSGSVARVFQFAHPVAIGDGNEGDRAIHH